MLHSILWTSVYRVRNLFTYVAIRSSDRIKQTVGKFCSASCELRAASELWSRYGVMVDGKASYSIQQTANSLDLRAEASHFSVLCIILSTKMFSQRIKTILVIAA
jgi:hypothetical protein